MATADPESGDDQSRGVMRRHRTDEHPITASITAALADAKGVCETDVDTCLYDRIDTDAIDRLYRHAQNQPDGSWSVEFSVDGWDVTVDDDGRIFVR